MGMLSEFFSRSKTIDNIFDKESGHLAKLGGWIGSQQFTDQERANLFLKISEGVQKYSVATLEENTDRSKARRRIAERTIDFYLLIIFMCGMTYPISKGWSLVWFDLATSAILGGLVVSISIFFYGSHALARRDESKARKK